MDGLADIAMHYLCMIEFSEEDEIDLDYAAREQSVWHLFFAQLSPDEKEALSAAAKRKLARMMPPVDEYGYDPGQLVTEEQKAFLNGCVSGEAFSAEL